MLSLDVPRHSKNSIMRRKDDTFNLNKQFATRRHAPLLVVCRPRAIVATLPQETASNTTPCYGHAAFYGRPTLGTANLPNLCWWACRSKTPHAVARPKPSPGVFRRVAARNRLHEHLLFWPGRQVCARPILATAKHLCIRTGTTASRRNSPEGRRDGW